MRRRDSANIKAAAECDPIEKRPRVRLKKQWLDGINLEKLKIMSTNG